MLNKLFNNPNTKKMITLACLVVIIALFGVYQCVDDYYTDDIVEGVINTNCCGGVQAGVHYQETDTKPPDYIRRCFRSRRDNGEVVYEWSGFPCSDADSTECCQNPDGSDLGQCVPTTKGGYCESNNAHYASIKAPAHADFSSGTNFTYTLPSGYGSNGQVLQSNGSGGTSWTALTDSTKLPLTGGTLTGTIIVEDAINENVYSITDGSSVDLNPDNGMIQTWDLGADRTATSSLTSGQSMLLKVTTSGSNSYSLTFPNGTKFVGGTTPTISSSEETMLEIFHIGSTLYVANVGDFET